MFSSNYKCSRVRDGIIIESVKAETLGNYTTRPVCTSSQLPALKKSIASQGQFLSFNAAYSNQTCDISWAFFPSLYSWRRLVKFSTGWVPVVSHACGDSCIGWCQYLISHIETLGSRVEMPTGRLPYRWNHSLLYPDRINQKLIQPENTVNILKQNREWRPLIMRDIKHRLLVVIEPDELSLWILFLCTE